MLEHMSNLPGGDARKRERGKLVFGEKLGASGFVAVLRAAAAEFAEEKEFVSVEGVRRMAVEVTVIEGSELGDTHVVAGLFPGFAGGSGAGRFTDVNPAAWEGPAAILEFAHKKNAAVMKDSDANVDLGCGVAGLVGEERGDGFIGRKGSTGGHDFRSNSADLLITLDVKLVLAESQTRLRDGLETARPGEPLRIRHTNILAADDEADKPRK
jgi:hypothetical protein